ncbi:hypothetical protein Trydic_g12855 [Trypoxylus dichotomus]
MDLLLAGQWLRIFWRSHGSLEPLTDRRSEVSGKFLVKLINNHIDATKVLAHIDFVVPQFGTRTCVTFQVLRGRSNMSNLDRSHDRECERTVS